MKSAFTFLLKAIVYKNEALVVLSSGASLGLTYYIDKLLIDTEIKYIILPMVVSIVGFAFFFLFILLDFGTGIYASSVVNARKENPEKNYIKSYKLWRTIWKVAGVVLICALLGVLTIFTEIIDSTYFYYFFLGSQTMIWLLACLFEFHSVGENIEKFSGSKPDIFGYLDKILEMLQLRFLESVNTIIKRKVEKIEESEENEKSDENETTTNN